MLDIKEGTKKLIVTGTYAEWRKFIERLLKEHVAGDISAFIKQEADKD